LPVVHIATWLWLLAAVFMGANLFIHVPNVAVAPATSMASIIIATGISIVVMWVSGFIMQSARRESQDQRCRSLIPAKKRVPCCLYLLAFLMPFGLRSLQQLASSLFSF
jgi:hypothetical protein